MTQRSQVPKFGDWESEENVPYTAYFEKARKGRGTKMINPNDPKDNPDLLSDHSSSAQQGPTSRARAEPELEEPVIRPGTGRSTPHEPRSREDSDLRQFTDSPARHDHSGSGASSESSGHQRHGGRGVSSGETHRRPARFSGDHQGSEYSVDRSPLRQARVPAARDGGVNSHSSEGKTSYDSSHGTAGRNRVKSETRGDETPEKGAAVPKFGEWDENNPASAYGFTHIFNKVREERQIGMGRVPGPPETHYNNMRNQDADDNAKCSCFPWGRK
ncbi:RPM1-interacting protein 4-like isoform X2 [Juglans microcarpa x Juglans regia]|uniref:RPM1-interacting protein 4-like isoform X2 n=1 Tax=Juglans microcarpa x Juglans regia TaxID=2249226 RepID=UPI001B7F5E06|nr:RPM1-interacting protein 4-like isoform X2 [Juglans microcarpa x Juglans regia]XP_041025169.1 RPM1-interacting protein 4-like isoform X2 [Juglans microcarpa x Juglans regia]